MKRRGLCGLLSVAMAAGTMAAKLYTGSGR